MVIRRRASDDHRMTGSSSNRGLGHIADWRRSMWRENRSPNEVLALPARWKVPVHGLCASSRDRRHITQSISVGRGTERRADSQEPDRKTPLAGRVSGG